MKIWVKILTAFLSFAAIGGLAYGGYIFYQNQVKQTEEKTNIDFNVEDEFKDKEIFPSIYAADFYDTIQVVNGKVFINEKLVEKFIKNIVTNLQVSYGTIEFKYQINDEKNTINIELLWTYKQHKVNKNYVFNLTKDVVE